MIPRSASINICRSLGHASADCVLSGLPWAGFKGDEQQRVLGAVVRALKPGGIDDDLRLQPRGVAAGRATLSQIARIQLQRGHDDTDGMAKFSAGFRLPLSEVNGGTMTRSCMRRMENVAGR